MFDIFEVEAALATEVTHQQILDFQDIFTAWHSALHMVHYI